MNNKYYLSFVAVVFAIACLVLSAINIYTEQQATDVKPVSEEIQTRQEETIYTPVKRSVFAYDVPSRFEAVECLLSKETQEYAYYVASGYGIDFELIMAVMSVESGFDPNAISDSGDYGLMQINKCNASWLSEEIGIDDLLNPYQNIHAGAYILEGLFEKYGDANKVLMAYNMGEAGAKKLWDRGIYETKYTKKVFAEMGVEQ